MLEMWPSPTPRTLMMKRVLPGGNPSWSGCATIDGLKRAAASIAYSCVKNAPMSCRRAFDTRPGRGSRWATSSKRLMRIAGRSR